MGVELVSLVGLVHYGKGHTKSQPLEVAHLLGQGDGLRGKVNLQLEESGMSGPLAGDVEDLSLHHLLP